MMKIILTMLVLSSAAYWVRCLYLDYLNRPWIAIKAKLLEVNIILSQGEEGSLVESGYTPFKFGINYDDHADREYDLLDSVGRNKFFRHFCRLDFDLKFTPPHKFQAVDLKCSYEFGGNSYVSSCSTYNEPEYDLIFEAGEILTLYINPKNPFEISYHQKHKAISILMVKYFRVIVLAIFALIFVFFTKL